MSATTPGSTPIRRSGSKRARLLLPVVGFGLLVACVGVLVIGPPETHTVSHVTQTVRETALAASRPNAPLGAGFIGPWKVSAERVDSSGRLVNFKLESGAMLLAARTARIVVDAEANTFGFELRDVSFLRVPEDAEAPASGMHAMDDYVLGPVPYEIDIVPDGPGDYSTPGDDDATSPMARAQRALDGD